MPEVWYQARKKIGDIRHTLPQGVIGPSFNDEFGDTNGNVFALVGDVPYAELKRHAEAIRGELLRLPDVAKVSFIGEQEQRVYLELSNPKLATFGLSVDDVVGALARQNLEAAAGAFETGSERIYLRPDGHDSAHPERLLRAHGGGHHGGAHGGHPAHPAVPASALRGLVPGQTGGIMPQRSSAVQQVG